MNILIESMTKIVVGNFTIRCWRQEENYNSGITATTTNEIMSALGKIEVSNRYDIAKHLLSIERMNAVEVLDNMSDGVVLYLDWP